MIKLRTKFSDKPPDAACIECLKHDAAVAHALVKAINGPLPTTCDRIEWAAAMRWLDKRAAEILRTDFGIIEESP